MLFQKVMDRLKNSKSWKDSNTPNGEVKSWKDSKIPSLGGTQTFQMEK